MKKPVPTISINGRKGRDLHSSSVLAPKVIKLARPVTSVICNASAPKAPKNYAWPHLAMPPRQINN